MQHGPVSQQSKCCRTHKGLMCPKLGGDAFEKKNNNTTHPSSNHDLNALESRPFYEPTNQLYVVRKLKWGKSSRPKINFNSKILDKSTLKLYHNTFKLRVVLFPVNFPGVLFYWFRKKTKNYPAKKEPKQLIKQKA